MPDELIAVIDKLMQKQPANRYAGCAEVIEALRPFAGQANNRKVTQTMRALPKLDGLRRAGLAPERTAPERPVTPRPGAADGPAPAPRANQPLRPVAPSRLGRVPTPPPAAAPEPPADTAAADAASPEAPAQKGRFGTFGIVMLAALAGAAAWLVSSLFLVR